MIINDYPASTARQQGAFKVFREHPNDAVTLGLTNSDGAANSSLPDHIALAREYGVIE